MSRSNNIRLVHICYEQYFSNICHFLLFSNMVFFLVVVVVLCSFCLVLARFVRHTVETQHSCWHSGEYLVYIRYNDYYICYVYVLLYVECRMWNMECRYSQIVCFAARTIFGTWFVIIIFFFVSNIEGATRIIILL